MEIKYVVGNLFELLPIQEPTYKVIPHICNDIGGWGSGFVVAVSKQWPMTEVGDISPEGQYRKWFADKSYEYRKPDMNVNEIPFELGQVQWVHADERLIEVDPGVKKQSTTFVVNMIGQHKTIRTNLKPIRYGALVQCMTNIRDRFLHHKALQGRWHNCPMEIHAPKFGSERAGGNWEFIEELIDELWLSHELPVTVYEYKG